MGDYKPITPDGHPRDEVVSALQKAIRRGEAREAVYWASQIEMMGQIHYLWQRLIIILHEDIGIAAVTLLPYVETCRQHYYWFLENGSVENLPLLNAVLAMAWAPKSRAAISAHILAYQIGETQGADHYEVPDYAKDMHTEAGRRLRRGIEHFQAEGDTLVNERLELDPDKDEAMLKGQKSKERPEYQRFVERQKGKNKPTGKSKSAGSLFDAPTSDDAPSGMGDYFSK